MMNTLLKIIQIIMSLGLLNVWILRFSKITPYRGGNSKSLKDEFSAYGLPSWFCYFIGFLKIGSALVLIAGLWFSKLVLPAAILVNLLMLGAILMHFKIRDPLIKSLPAFMMLVLSLIICVNLI